MDVLDQIGQGLWNAFQMAWEVWWALVLGFLLSGIVQAWAPRHGMERALGGRGLRSAALATGFGAASSSCSYAAVAIAKSTFQKGASLPGRRPQLQTRLEDAVEGDRGRLPDRGLRLAAAAPRSQLALPDAHGRGGAAVRERARRAARRRALVRLLGREHSAGGGALGR